MNSNYENQYQEMKRFFDNIRKEVELQPNKDVTISEVLNKLNSFELEHAMEPIEYPIFTSENTQFKTPQRKNRNQMEDSFYLVKGACIPPHMTFAFNNASNPHRKLHRYEIIIPAKKNSCDMIVTLLSSFLFDKKIEADGSASTYYGNANIRIFLENEQDAELVKNYCFSQPLIFLNMKKTNPFISRVTKELKDKKDTKKISLGVQTNPSGTGTDTVEMIAALITEYIEQARIHNRIEFITVDKFMSSLKGRVPYYLNDNPKRALCETLLETYQQAKEYDRENIVKPKLVDETGGKEYIRSVYFA